MAAAARVLQPAGGDARQQHAGVSDQRAAPAQGRQPRGHGLGVEAHRLQIIQVGGGVDEAAHQRPNLRRQMMVAGQGLDTPETFGLDLLGQAGLPVHVYSLDLWVPGV
jgi:hypothetical protein